jgi:hypothetical protein
MQNVDDIDPAAWMGHIEHKIVSVTINGTRAQTVQLSFLYRSKRSDSGHLSESIEGSCGGVIKPLASVIISRGDVASDLTDFASR